MTTNQHARRRTSCTNIMMYLRMIFTIVTYVRTKQPKIIKKKNGDLSK